MTKPHCKVFLLCKFVTITWFRKPFFIGNLRKIIVGNHLHLLVSTHKKNSLQLNDVEQRRRANAVFLFVFFLQAWAASAVEATLGTNWDQSSKPFPPVSCLYGSTQGRKKKKKKTSQSCATTSAAGKKNKHSRRSSGPWSSALHFLHS